jgi:hypothetical protein
MAIEPDFEKFRKIKAANVDKLMAKKNVVGVGIGTKVKTGQTTGELAIRVYVIKKQNLKELKAADAVPETIDGVPTDVVEIGEPIPYSYTARERPAIGGDSIGHFKVTAGTLGCLMRDKTDGSSVILSNNHVLADRDALNHPRASAGDCIVQPGTLDGGLCAADQIATLKRWIKLNEVGSGTNLVDAAIAQPLSAGDVRNDIHEIGCVSKWREVSNADVILNLADPDNVQKSGRTTEYTTGKITDIDATVTINYGVFSARHEHVIATDDMALPGDSGSLLVDMNKKALGLLFGGSPGSVVFYSRISNVLNALNLEFMPCDTTCLFGPFHCHIGGPSKPCKSSGPMVVCHVGGPYLICKTGGPMILCRVGGPGFIHCASGPDVQCHTGGPWLQFCKTGPIVGCLAGPPLMDDPRERIVDPADITGQIIIDADRLTQEQKVNVANLVNKLRGTK